MQDILNSIKAYLYDRAVSPLIGAFVVAWSVWNYRFFVVLFSSEFANTSEKFAAIDVLFGPDVLALGKTGVQISGCLTDGAFMPAVLALLYLYAYPLVAKPVYEHSLRQQKELRSVKQALDDQRLLSVEESRELYRRLAQLQTRHQEEVDLLNSQISALSQPHEEISRDDAQTRAQDTKEAHGLSEKDAEQFAEFDKYIHKIVESQEAHTSFFLNELFGQKRWLEIPLETRLKLEKRFKEQVERGDFVGVKLNGNRNAKQQNYYRN